MESDDKESVVEALREMADMIEKGEEVYSVYAIFLGEDKNEEQYTMEVQGFTPGRFDALSAMHLNIVAESVIREHELGRIAEGILSESDDTQH